MKRIGSLLLSFVMLVCIMPLSAVATSPVEADSEKLIFDMDLSNYNGTTGIANSVEGNDSVFAYSTNKPNLKTVDKTNTPYITFHETDGSNKSNAFKVTDAGFASQNELTVETWVKPDTWDSVSANSLMFALYSGTSNVMDVSKWGGVGLWDYCVDGDSFKKAVIRPGAAALTPHDESWTHLVFTRKWTPDSEGATTGTWTGQFYINGDQYYTSKTSAQVTRFDEGNAATMFIGSRWLNNGNDYKGSMGEFKVYQSILSADSIKAKYEATKGDYYYEVAERELGEDKLFFDMGIADDGTITNAKFDDGGSVITSGGVTVNETVTGKKYLTFSEAGKPYTNPYVKVADKYLINQDELTLEMWVRPKDWQGTRSSLTNQGSRMFCLTAGSGENSYMDYYTYAPGVHYYQAAGNMSNKWVSLSEQMYSYDERWTHLMFTRKWTPNADGTTGTWNASVYVNGALKKEGTLANVSRNVEGELTALFIGNESAGGTQQQAFNGDIAMVKAYQMVLDGDAAQANYEATRPTYYPEAPAEGEKLVFDMDISSYSDANTVRNASPYGDTTITVGGTTKPVLGTLANGTKYLNFKESYESATTKAYVSVTDPNFLNQNTMTIETWVRPKDYVARSRGERLFKLGGYWDMYRWSTTYLRHQPAGDGKQPQAAVSSVAPYNNMWTHMVFTRTWTPDEGAETGTWSSSFYINGKRVDSAADLTGQTRALEATATALLIGNSSTNSDSEIFIGDIATFKVYQSSLDATQIASKYNESRGAYAEYGDEKLVFDMDLTNYTDENPVVTSKDCGNNVITVQGTLASGELVTGQKYLTFDNAAGENNKAGIKVIDNTLMNQEAMTVETWVRGTNFGAKDGMGETSRIFEGPRMLARGYDLSGNTALWYEPNGDNASFRIQRTNMSAYDDKWTHLAFTKSYDEAEGTWTGTLYINGSKYTSKEYEAAFGDEKSNVLMIGNSKDLTCGFEGDIATFKVYNTELTAEQIKAKFNESDDVINTLVKVDEFTTISTEVKATVDSSLTSQNPYILMALYDKDGRMIQVAEGQTLTIDGDITLEAGYYVRCFVWSSATEIIPLSKDAIAYCL